MSDISEDDKKRYKKEYEKKQIQYLKELFLVTRGRVTRLDYFIFCYAIKHPKKHVIRLDTEFNFYPLGLIFWCFFQYICWCLLAKRFRDIGLSGWYSVPLSFMNTFYTAFLIFDWNTWFNFDDQYVFWSLHVFALINLPLFLWPSQKKDNKYGSYPAISVCGKYKPEDHK